MLSKQRRRLLLAIILAGGTILRFSSIGFGLPHQFARPDEEHIAQAASHVVGGDFDPHFFLYPTFFIYLTAAGYTLLSGIARALGPAAAAATFVDQALGEQASLRLVARELAAASGVLTIAALYAATSELFSRRAALAAAAFLAVAFLHVRDSHFGVTDVPATFLIVCAFWAALRCATRGVTIPRAALAGCLCGLAASTKYNAVIVVLPALVAVGFEVLRSGRLEIGPALEAVAVLMACAALAFLVATPFALLDRPAFLKDFVEQSQVARGVDHSSILADARSVLGERGWMHHATFTLRYGVGLPLLLVSLAGAVWLAMTRPSSAALVLSFPVVFYAVMGSNTLAYARWMVPIVPFLCLTAGVLVDAAAETAGAVFPSPRAIGVAAIAAVVVLGAPTAAQSIAFDRLMARTDSRLLAARWIEDRFPTGALLYQTGRRYGHVEPGPVDRYPHCEFNETSRGFECAGAHGTRGEPLPDLVVVLESPLEIFSRVPGTLGPILDAKYEPIASFQGIAPAGPSAALYDQQDAFFVPFGGMRSVKRPGPGVRIFRRRS